MQTVDLQLTARDNFSGDLAYEFLMIEYDVLVAEQFAYRMGRELARISTEDPTFINMRRLQVWISFHNVEKCHNYFIQTLMRRKFKEGANAYVRKRAVHRSGDGAIGS